MSVKGASLPFLLEGGGKIRRKVKKTVGYTNLYVYSQRSIAINVRLPRIWHLKAKIFAIFSANKGAFPKELSFPSENRNF